MDFDRELAWRASARSRHCLTGSAREFVAHAGSFFLIEWRIRPFDGIAFGIDSEMLVHPRFSNVASDMCRQAERYYHELHHPTPGFHPRNICEALRLATGCMNLVGQWLATCRASSSIIIEMFDTVHGAVGRIATSVDLVDAVSFERIAEATIETMCESRRRAGCPDVRIVA